MFIMLCIRDFCFCIHRWNPQGDHFTDNYKKFSLWICLKYADQDGPFLCAVKENFQRKLETNNLA